MSFSLKQARYFMATAQTGQVSKAAIELNVSQSAVTAAIQQLENLLETKLLERRNSGVTVTLAGARFLRHAEHILASVNEALNVAGDDLTGSKGKIRIGMSYTVAGYFAPPLIVRAQRNFPDIEFHLREAERQTIEEEICNNELDLAIVLTSNIRPNPEIKSRTLVKSRRRLWVSAEHPLTNNTRITLGAISDYPYIALTVDEALKTQKNYWEKAGVSPNVVFETSSVEAVRSMVAAGMGITVLSDMVFRPWSLEGQRLETRDLDRSVPSMNIGLIWKHAAGLNPLTALIVEYLTRSIVQQPKS